MSTVKSSAENLTLNADGVGNDIKFQSNATEIAAIDQAGNLTLSGTVDGVDIQTLNTAVAANTAKVTNSTSASDLTSGTLPDARFPSTLPAISGANLTGIDAATVSTTAPSSPSAGDMWFDSTAGTTAMKVYSGTGWDQMSNRNDGATQGSSATLAVLAGYYTSGKHSLWVDIDGTAMQLMVDFDATGGPWVMLAFKFGTGGVNGQNDDLYIAGADANGPLNNTGRSGRTLNLGLGDGAETVTTLWGATTLATSGSEAGGYFPVYGVYGPHTIEYYNFATSAQLSSSYKTGLQGWVSAISSETPHVMAECDSQGLTSSTNWLLQTGPSTDSGHQGWLRDKDNYFMRGTNGDTSTDESWSAYVWTHNTYTAIAAAGASTPGRGGGSPSGLPTDPMILPESVHVAIGTGGGIVFGTPSNSSLSNEYDSRTYFLVK